MLRGMKHDFDAEELNLIKLAQEYADDDSALLESLRWPEGAICPHCKNDGKEKPNSKLTGKPGSKRAVRKGVYFCGACRKQFTVTVGTVFEGSHIPISKWLMAMSILCSAKKSVSAHQLHRMLSVTYKTAWFMAHRIRFAMGDSGPDKLTGVVEVDETWIGGKAPEKTKFKNKSTLVAMVQRDGGIRTQVIASVTQKNLRQCLNECVDKSAIVNTDEHPAYKLPLSEYQRHDAVNHSKLEYSRQNPDGTTASVNSCESFFSLLKRGVHGSWHHVSKEHLPKYSGEFAFRWTHRKITDGERMVEAVNR